MDECLLYADPELYDTLFPDAGGIASVIDDARRARVIDSERFYLEEARQAGGRGLELGCGSGRLTVPIAQSGIEVIGLDTSRPMLEAARRKADACGVTVDFIEADMRRFDLGRDFSAILIPGNSLLHLLTTEELKQCLTCVRQHLAPNGHLVFDISKWDLRVLAKDSGQRVPVLTANDPVRGEITIEETTNYDGFHQVRHFQWNVLSTGSPARKIEYSLRVIYPQELVLLLEVAGLNLQARYGEFPRQLFDSSSPRQICVCSAA